MGVLIGGFVLCSASFMMLNFAGDNCFSINCGPGPNKPFCLPCNPTVAGICFVTHRDACAIAGALPSDISCKNGQWGCIAKCCPRQCNSNLESFQCWNLRLYFVCNPFHNHFVLFSSSRRLATDTFYSRLPDLPHLSACSKPLRHKLYLIHYKNGGHVTTHDLSTERHYRLIALDGTAVTLPMSSSTKTSFSPCVQPSYWT